MYTGDALAVRIAHDEHRRLYDYWQTKAPPGKLPARKDIDPLDIPGMLPRIALIDVLREAEGVTFRYRLAGTEIVERAGRDPTGRRFDELYRGDYLVNAVNTYSHIVEAAAPHLSERTFPLVEGKEFLRYDRLILPLAADGRTVDMLILLIAVIEHRRDDRPSANR
ncbi:PAS domain-containing protein [Ferruginivarius sediminum]|uniref:PAS domain-containing protein n=1 Tax=Ferruginivarius sediminum TaxID=2661937 RepID=A0A369TET5_9PROT|nr:PAS domain-containing protein [Ferruginivarius sediminum]RDD62637.1 PAS domain-containing protein [Ferruginivarius sediminum]